MSLHREALAAAPAGAGDLQSSGESDLPQAAAPSHVPLIAAQFDAAWYLDAYPDVAAAGVDPLEHYLRHGARERRHPNPDFDPAAYLARYPDVEASGMDPFLHWLAFGQAEGRTLGGPLPDIVRATMAAIADHFDSVWYASAYPDVVHARVDPLEHYVRHGSAEGRNPRADFDVSLYRARYPDIADSGIDPLAHWLQNGRAEGRQAGPLLTPQMIARALGPDRPMIVSFSHDDYLTVPGGTQLCIGVEQTAAQEAGYDYLHLFPLRPVPRLRDTEPVIGAALGLSLNGVPLGGTSYAAVTEWVGDRSSRGAPTSVVLHHAMGHSLEAISKVVQAAGGRCLWWLHDFFVLWEDPGRLREWVLASAGEGPDASVGPAAAIEIDGDHAAHVSRFFTDCQVQVVAPSPFVARIIREAASLPFDSLVVQPHMSVRWHSAEPEAPPDEGPLRIAFVGAPVEHKGWPSFAALVRHFEREEGVAFHYFGTYPTDLEIECHAVSASGETPFAMIEALQANRIDVLLHMTRMPETFSLTTHEALAAGAIVVTNTMSGNIADVVRDLGRGLILKGDADLFDLLTTGELQQRVAAARRARVQERAEVRFSRMSLDVLLLPQPDPHGLMAERPCAV